MGKLGFGLAVGIAAVTCVVAAAMVGSRTRSWKKWNRAVEVLSELEAACGTPVTRLRQIVDAMAVEMHAGLASEGGSKLKMLLTFVDRLPTGGEKGTYYALDLGATNFRILQVHLEGGSRTIKHEVEALPIPNSLLSGTSEELFEFIASSLKDFTEREVQGSELSSAFRREIGFSFSFPVKQLSVSSGILIKWTKGFSVNDMVEKDVAECLQQAVTKKGLDMHVAALVNDSVGTLALGHYYDEDTVAAVLIGTGTNACYLEKSDAIIKCQGLLTTSGCMVVNIEWANFWSSHLPRTPYDIDLDLQSHNPHEQGFEKMISGMYLGEIVRRVLLRLSEQSDVFGPVASSRLSVPFILRTPLIAAMHEDNSPDLREAARILQEVLEIGDAPLKLRKLVVNVCDITTRRAARLVAAGIVGILKKIGRDGSGRVTTGRPTASGVLGTDCTSGSHNHGVRSSSQGGGGTAASSGPPMRRTVVALEGAVYRNYRKFREYLEEAVAQILGDDLAPFVILKEVEDGSGIGAALVAASYSMDSV